MVRWSGSKRCGRTVLTSVVFNSHAYDSHRMSRWRLGTAVFLLLRGPAPLQVITPMAPNAALLRPLERLADAFSALQCPRRAHTRPMGPLGDGRSKIPPEIVAKVHLGEVERR